MKKCTCCQEEKEYSMFYADNRRKDGRMARCKSCKNKAFANYRKSRGYDKVRYWKSPEKERERHLVRKYGVSAADYAKMFDAQGGACAICEKRQVRALDVDHCHVTLKVRGLLCTNCNRMLGHAGDDSVRLERAANYLKLAVMG